MYWMTQRSFRATLLTVFMVLVLVSLVAVGLFAYRTAEGALVEGAGQRLEDVAFNAIDKLDRNLFERYGDIQAFA